jgi:hypothetical protein
MIGKTTISEGDDMSEIQSLVQRVQNLTQSVDWWNTAMIYTLALAAIAAIAVVLTTRKVVTEGSKLAEAQSELIRAKDEKLARDLHSKDLEIATVNERAAKAELALAQQANPREIVLSSRDGDDVERSRRASEVKKFSGTRVLVQAMPDFEPKTLASAIAAVLASEYKWHVELIDPERSRIPFSILGSGVKVITLEESLHELGDPAEAKVKMPAPAKSKSYQAALALVNLLDLDLGEPYGPAYFGVHWEPEWDDPRFRRYTHWGFDLPRDTVLILVGAKPVAGATEIHKKGQQDLVK